MTLQPVKDLSEYKRIKEALRDRFEAERTGDQDLFREQSKIFRPLINTQQQTVKAIKNSENTNATTLANALVPFTRELQKRNEQVDMLTEQPFYQQELPAPENLALVTPGGLSSSILSPEIMNVDLDAGLNETDKENLEDMSFELPSKVFKNKVIEETLEKIKIENRSIGQKLGKGPAGQKVDAKEKAVYHSQRQTLEKYKQIINSLEGAKQFVSTPKKAGKGLEVRGRTGGKARGNPQTDVIYYHNMEDLCHRLSQLHAAKQAGNNGLDNSINSILDELLRIKAINKDEYDILHKNLFYNIQ